MVILVQNWGGGREAHPRVAERVAEHVARVVVASAAQPAVVAQLALLRHVVELLLDGHEQPLVGAGESGVVARGIDVARLREHVLAHAGVAVASARRGEAEAEHVAILVRNKRQHSWQSWTAHAEILVRNQEAGLAHESSSTLARASKFVALRSMQPGRRGTHLREQQHVF